MTRIGCANTWRGSAWSGPDWSSTRHRRMQTLEDLLTTGAKQVIFSCIAGSRAYGTQVQGSDEDVRGLYIVPATAYLPLSRPPPQLSDERGNTVYSSLRRCIELLAEANPTILELLFPPPDC